MSFLAGRLASTEGAFFAQQSKIAASRLKDKLGNTVPPSTAKEIGNSESKADVLPEILSHSIPLYTGEASTSSMSVQSSLASASTIGRGSRESDHFGGHHDPNLVHMMNPVNSLVSVPRATFGPKRWSLPSEEQSLLASTANEARRDHTTSTDTEKMKDAMEGLSMIGKAFAVATGIVFGSAIFTTIITITKLQLHSRDDVQREGRKLLQPKVEVLKEWFGPIKTWVETMSRTWHLDENKKRAIGAEFAQGLGMKEPNGEGKGH